jgi:uncharacterized protein (DUF3084 family)
VTDEELKSLFEGLRQDTGVANAELRNELAATNAELRRGFEAVRQEFAAVHEEFGAVHQELSGVRQEFAAVHEEFGAVHQELSGVRQEFTAVHEEFVAVRQENAAAHAETRRHFEVALEGNRSEIRLVAEGVVQTREELGRLDEKIERTAAETQAMIKFSHVELDRRVRTLEGSQRTLEEGLADLQVRVERLESSTH